MPLIFANQALPKPRVFIFLIRRNANALDFGNAMLLTSKAFAFFVQQMRMPLVLAMPDWKHQSYSLVLRPQTIVCSKHIASFFIFPN
jgi:hypothetical protein